ncbi:unnamed protein product, partial [Effrenium voratum]
GKEWRRKAVVRVDADAIGRHCEVRAAHGSSIQAMVMTEQGIYTVSQDKTMKRWKPTRNGSVFELVPEVSVPLPDSGHSLLFSNGWLFCGLWDGQIQAFAQDGTQSVLKGHSKRVTTLLVHQGVLMTGSADKELRLWQMDSAAKTFNCTHTIEESLPGPINKIHVLGGHLFVGGHYGLAMLDLASLKVTKLLPPTKSVTDILEFQGHVIVAYSEGVIRIFDAEGNLKTESKALDAGPILKLAGLDSGPRVLCGHAHGQVSTIQLPSFEFKTEFQALPGHKVDSLLCAGHDGIFLIGSQDGLGAVVGMNGGWRKVRMARANHRPCPSAPSDAKCWKPKSVDCTEQPKPFSAFGSSDDLAQSLGEESFHSHEQGGDGYEETSEGDDGFHEDDREDSFFETEEQPVSFHQEHVPSPPPPQVHHSTHEFNCDEGKKCTWGASVLCPDGKSRCGGSGCCPDGSLCPSAPPMVPGTSGCQRDKVFDCTCAVMPVIVKSRATCLVGESVTCPNTKAKCAGAGCCPDGSTCPSAPLGAVCPLPKTEDCTGQVVPKKFELHDLDLGQAAPTATGLILAVLAAGILAFGTWIYKARMRKSAPYIRVAQATEEA